MISALGLLDFGRHGWANPWGRSAAFQESARPEFWLPSAKDVEQASVDDDEHVFDGRQRYVTLHWPRGPPRQGEIARHRTAAMRSDTATPIRWVAVPKRPRRSGRKPSS